VAEQNSSQPSHAQGFKPPVDQSVASWIQNWLPGAYARQCTKQKGLARTPRLRLSVSGLQGGEYFLQGRGPDLRVEAALGKAQKEEDFDIWVRISDRDLRALVYEDPDLAGIFPTEADPAAELVPSAADVDRLLAINGRLRLEITGKRRRRFSFDIAVGAAGLRAGRPRTAVTVAARILEELASGALAPLQVLIAGGVTLNGDRALALQFLTLLTSRWPSAR